MNYELLGAIIATALIIAYIVLPRPGPRAAVAEDKGRDRDCLAVEQGYCPDCRKKGTLLSGPSGGMAQNIACNSCLMEFNVGFGFGTGVFMVDRSGKLTGSRARVFGIEPEEYAAIRGALDNG